MSIPGFFAQSGGAQIVSPGGAAGQIVSPAAQIMSPAAQVVTPAAQIMTPAAQIVTPAAQIMTPAAQVVSPSAQVVSPAAAAAAQSLVSLHLSAPAPQVQAAAPPPPTPVTSTILTAPNHVTNNVTVPKTSPVVNKVTPVKVAQSQPVAVQSKRSASPPIKVPHYTANINNNHSKVNYL